MRTKTFLRTAVIAIALFAASASAWATRTSTALGICISRGPACSITNKGDDYEICVDNSDGKQCVSCPNLAQPADKQECSVARTDKGVPEPKVGVAGLLAEEYTAPTSKAEPVPGKP